MTSLTHGTRDHILLNKNIEGYVQETVPGVWHFFPNSGLISTALSPRDRAFRVTSTFQKSIPICIIILKIQILKLSNPIKALGVLHQGSQTQGTIGPTQVPRRSKVGQVLWWSHMRPAAPPWSLEILYICLRREASMPIPVRKPLPSGHRSNRVFQNVTTEFSDLVLTTDLFARSPKSNIQKVLPHPQQE